MAEHAAPADISTPGDNASIDNPVNSSNSPTGAQAVTTSSAPPSSTAHVVDHAPEAGTQPAQDAYQAIARCTTPVEGLSFDYITNESKPRATTVPSQISPVAVECNTTSATTTAEGSPATTTSDDASCSVTVSDNSGNSVTGVLISESCWLAS